MKMVTISRKRPQPERLPPTENAINQVSFLSGAFTDSEMAWCGYGWNIVGKEEKKDVLLPINTDKVIVQKRIKINL